MESKQMLFPLFAMLLLVCVVAGTMLRRRVAFMKTNRLHPQKVATSAEMSAAISDTRASDNFRNLFEVPVLFYTIVLVIFVTKIDAPILLALAWGYVVARCFHSYFQCTSNVVMQRFYAFLTSCTILILMWVVTLVNLLIN